LLCQDASQRHREVDDRDIRSVFLPYRSQFREQTIHQGHVHTELREKTKWMGADTFLGVSDRVDEGVRTCEQFDKLQGTCFDG
jgi:hypothetical protein